MITRVKLTPTNWKWLQRGMDLAKQARTWSKDPKCQVGACVAPTSFRQFSLGFNGLPAEIPDSDEILNNKERKNELMRHAEANAISNAPFSVEGCYIFVTRSPCVDCAVNHIIANGIKYVVIARESYAYDRKSTRFNNLQRALQYLEMANVKVIYV